MVGRWSASQLSPILPLEELFHVGVRPCLFAASEGFVNLESVLWPCPMVLQQAFVVPFGDPESPRGSGPRTPPGFNHQRPPPKPRKRTRGKSAVANPTRVAWVPLPSRALRTPERPVRSEPMRGSVWTHCPARSTLPRVTLSFGPRLPGVSRRSRLRARSLERERGLAVRSSTAPGTAGTSTTRRTRPFGRRPA